MVVIFYHGNVRAGRGSITIKKQNMKLKKAHQINMTEPQFPSWHFKLPVKCITCGITYDSGDNCTFLGVPKRKDFLLKKRYDEACAEIATIQNKFLGQHVCPAPSSCYNSCKKI
jgi:hypothetical protein